MAWLTFGSLAAGNQNLVLYDTQFANTAAFGIVDCTASGTNGITLTPILSGYTGPAYANNVKYGFIAANASTGAVTLGVGALSLLKLFQIDGTTQVGNGGIVAGRFYVVSYNAALDSAVGGWIIISSQLMPSDIAIPRDYISGLTLSTAGGSTTMTVAAGQAVDSTNTYTMNLASSIGKTTSAWAVGTGNGGLDTGAIANSTWYHFYEMKRLDTGVVDIIFTLSPSLPALPASYTIYRYIGSGLTDGSGNWASFTQDGDYFAWTVPTVDLSAGAWTSTAANQTISVPTGFNIIAFGFAQGVTSGSVSQFALYDPATNDFTVAGGTALTASRSGSLTQSCFWQVRTNTSAQIRKRSDDAAATGTISTFGYYNPRGKNA